MGDSQDNPAPAGIPPWQQRSEQGDQAAEFHDQLDVARRFLDDDDVRTASRDKKADFLRSKGVQDGDIEKLLDKPHVKPEPSGEKPVDNDDAAASQTISQREPDTTQQSPALLSGGSDHPPVVTYPEFLAKPPRPPPLVTTNGLLTTLYAFAGLSTLLYGASKYLVAPMVESLTDARSELHDTASHKLHALVSKLEKTVSEIPSTPHPPLAADDASEDAEDPTEMFHRDVGTQTSLPESPAAAALLRPVAKSESERQADRLSEAAKSLSGLKDQFRAQSEDLEDVRTLLDVFRDNLDGMTYSSQTQFVGGYDMYGTAKRAEPQDEIRRVRDNIRLVKGTLLSTRSFPASTR
ncbi:peroxisomal membrane anchor protein [Hirsutella rhossiliensis]|uniref:Peroxisomal membrane protein PEX14 n=1 Tax=Hirsutella rhossiliensis TaxID=111463 RepID=A0A9P8SM81_9HYPO|nr:peroxisomal membrane anchor protein [Hirsutella rhossiliensis]KAH0968298.1 peroxisomal membrane anchor protein [Hirsutella rhossiliensis]